LPQEIDWRNALGIIFWYCSGSIGKLSKALELYESSSLPFPSAPRIVKEGEESSSAVAEAKAADQDSTQHILFSLLKMFFSSSANSSGSSSLPLSDLLSKCLTPEGYTQDQLDYRGSYLTLLFLESTGILLPSSSASTSSISGKEQQQQPPLYPQAYYIVRQHMISQLLTEGLWQWAVFVSLQYDDPTLRQHTLRDIILRHTSFTVGWELNKSSDEYFLMTRYSIDPQLLYESTAYHCKYHRHHDPHHDQRHDHHRYLSQEIYYLNQSQHFSQALQLICQELVPLSIQNSTEMLLESLLNEMEEKYFSSYVPHGEGDGGGDEEGEEKYRALYFLWTQTGGLILSYLNLMNRYRHQGAGEVQAQDEETIQEMLTDAMELFEKFQGNFFGLCGVSCQLQEQPVVVKGAVYAIGSHLLEVISTILKEQPGCPAEYSQKFLGFLYSSSHETLPVYESEYLKYLRYEETMTGLYPAQQGEGYGDDEEKDSMSH
jgi:hypothetical protein